MDEIDRRILNHLCRRGRDSYREIGRRIDVSASTVMKRVKEMEGRGIIRGYRVEIDYDKLGYDFFVMVDVRVAKGKLQQIEKKIAKHPAVVAVFDNTGPFDSTVMARFKNRSSLDRFVKLLQTYDFVERTETRLILNTIKEGALRF
jgi:Lrp/AsnC family transcriptional regulator for asnA, asnC and gidA